MGEQPPLVRQWIMLKTLAARRQGVTVQELAAELGVCQKTIRRDLEAISQASFPLEEKVGEYGRKTWRLLPCGSRPELSFTVDEAISLYLGCHLLEPLAGTVFWEASRRAFRKIRAALGQGVLDYVDQFRAFFHETLIGAADYAQKADLIDQLVQGAQERRVVFITYRSLQATEPVTYDVHPYGITKHGHSLYLVGFSPQRNAIREWKIDRIEEARLDTFPFTRPANFDLEEYFAGSFGVFQGRGDIRVKVRFSATVARHVQESNWHASQRLTPQPDGSLLAQFDLSNTVEIARWILSFGQHAEVIGPPALREDVAAELAMMTILYQDTNACNAEGEQ